MALPINTQTTYASVGQREDLVNVIYDVSPWETPMLSSMANVNASGVLHEWQADSLAAPSATNWALEGDNATADASGATARLNNYTGITTKTASVTGTQDAVNKAGRDKEMAYQLIKRGKEIKTDIETALFNNNAKNAGAASTPRQVGGIETYIVTNTIVGVGGADGGGNGTTARTDGAAVAFTEAMLLDAHQSAWDNGGNPDKLFVGSFNKRTASGFTGIATKYKDVADKKTIASVDIFVSDFGEIKIIPSRHIRSRTALLLQSDQCAFATLRNMETIQLARQGDSDNKELLCEWTLEIRDETACALIADLTVV